MNITKSLSSDNTHLTITISGRFDFNVYKEFRDTYEEYLNKVSRITINMSKTEYLDSSALGMLLVLREQAGNDRANIEITGANSEIQKILSISNFDKMFAIK